MAEARILIVDDEEFNRDLLEQELADLGYAAQTASGGREALEMVAADPPDLILLDVMMPDIDGFTVCRTLKENPETQLIPIVIMTALNAREDRVRGIEAGADDFLSRPVDDRELQARITTALRTKRAVDRTKRELVSASAQIERLGSHTEQASLLAIELRVKPASDSVQESPNRLEDRYAAAYQGVLSMFSGTIADLAERPLLALIRGEDLAARQRSALEGAQAIQAETQSLNGTNARAPLAATVAIASGEVTVGSEKLERGEWVLTVDGPVVERALEVLASAEEGSVAADDPHLLLAASPGTSSTNRDSQGGLLWPAEFKDLEQAAGEEWGIEELYLHRVLSGKSGALVYAVDITTRDYSGQAILKLTDLDDPDWGEADEADRHREAVLANPAYAEVHLPEVIATLERDRRLVMLATIAARGLEYANPWAHCDFELQTKAARRMAAELLEEWNAAYQFDSGMIRPETLLSGWLAYRLLPEQGRLYQFLPGVLELEPLSESFLHEGHWFPNPLAFAVGTVSLPGHVGLRAAIGSTHGDLHGYNVLVGQENGSLAYYVIDLAHYQPGSYLLYDHAYFELSHLLNQRGATSLSNWISLLDVLERDAAPRADDVGICQLLESVREEIASWIDRREPNRRSYLDGQAMLARVAAGLNFASKRMPYPDRLRALLYASLCLKSYLKFHSIDWPKHGPELRTDLVHVT